MPVSFEFRFDTLSPRFNTLCGCAKKQREWCYEHFIGNWFKMSLSAISISLSVTSYNIYFIMVNRFVMIYVYWFKSIDDISFQIHMVIKWTTVSLCHSSKSGHSFLFFSTRNYAINLSTFNSIMMWWCSVSPVLLPNKSSVRANLVNG